MAEAVHGRGMGLGPAACTARVVGNMVGSGFSLAPSAMAPFGLLAIRAWIVTGAGAVCLGHAWLLPLFGIPVYIWRHHERPATLLPRAQI